MDDRKRLDINVVDNVRRMAERLEREADAQEEGSAMGRRVRERARALRREYDEARGVRRNPPRKRRKAEGPQGVPGPVSSGTLRMDVLLRRFANEIRDIYYDADRKPPQSIWAMLTEARVAADNVEAYGEDAAHELVAALIDTLNDLAPEDHYFGAHEGDGADFGFWWNED